MAAIRARPTTPGPSYESIHFLGERLTLTTFLMLARTERTEHKFVVASESTGRFTEKRTIQPGTTVFFTRGDARSYDAFRARHASVYISGREPTNRFAPGLRHGAPALLQSLGKAGRIVATGVVPGTLVAGVVTAIVPPLWPVALAGGAMLALSVMARAAIARS